MKVIMIMSVCVVGVLMMDETQEAKIDSLIDKEIKEQELDNYSEGYKAVIK